MLPRKRRRRFLGDIDNNGDLLMEYQLIRSNRRTLSASIKDGKLIVRAPLKLKESDIEKFLEDHRSWIEKQLDRAEEQKKELETVDRLTMEDIRKLADEAMKVIPERVKFYAEKIGVTYGGITIRNQRSKWGSCTAKGNLNFNCLLMLAPREVLDGVVVHELCHRKYMNHSDKFYAEVLKVFPEYRKWDKWLKDNGNILIRRMTGR